MMGFISDKGGSKELGIWQESLCKGLARCKASFYTEQHRVEDREHESVF
jgi:hypothetical protein